MTSTSTAPADAAPAKQPLALYLHIPFCSSKCGYCDFNSYAGLPEHVVDGYTPALLREIALWAPAARDNRVETVFFGGGTPSLTSIDDMAAIAAAIREHYDIAPDAEWSLEANPTELSREHLEGLRKLGINRLSMGVQSMQPDELELLERAHSPERVIQAVQDARAAGFDNMNLDLIFGIMGQPLVKWQDTLDRIIALGPEHLSCYALTVEEGTALHYRVAKGMLAEPDPDIAADEYEWTQRRLAEAGYQQYEISNWAKPGRACKHNLVYWHAEPYLGFGAGAHSFFLGRRLANVDAPNRYVDAINASWDEREATGTAEMHQVAGGETPDEATQRADAIILGLRLMEGVSLPDFERRFGVRAQDAFRDAIGKHIGLGLLAIEGDRLRLTPRGLLLSNEVFIDLLPDDDE